MPWDETCAMDERLAFVGRCLSGDESVTDLCLAFGISRKTGYKWLGRYRAGGAAGLAARSSAPACHGRLLDAEVMSRVLALRERWPSWGARKLRARLGMDHPDLVLPAASTIGDWLRREGCIAPLSRRQRTPAYTQPFAKVGAANDLWCVDFKGWFLTGDGARCDPLTVTDAHSRFLLGCEAVAAQDERSVRPEMERVFQEHGLPGAIRSDNGVPFASVGVGGLSRLSVWWLRLGIVPERIPPGCPQQNGRHERMHRTLREETAAPPACNVAAQQARFDRFRVEYNGERPHEALGQRPPGSAYAPSARPYPAVLPEVAYDAEQAVRRVRSNGQIKWPGELVFVGEALAGELAGVAETDRGAWLVRFAGVELGYIDGRQRRLNRMPPRPRKPLSREQPADLMESASALTTTPQAQPQQPDRRNT